MKTYIQMSNSEFVKKFTNNYENVKIKSIF